MRVDDERSYWDQAALDDQVDEKYICEAEYFDDCLGFLKQRVKGRVLEIGSGVGRLAIPLAKDHWVIGIDISENMIKTAQARSPKPRYILSNGRTIPVEDDTIDTVYSVAVFQHLKEAAVIMYIQEAARVLTDNGQFIFQFIEGTESEEFSNHYQIEHIESILNQNGLKIKELKRGVGHHLWTWVVACK